MNSDEGERVLNPKNLADVIYVRPLGWQPGDSQCPQITRKLHK